MTTQLVVGLFPSSGVALDAYHRLRTEGVPPSRLAYHVLKEIGLPPPMVQTELEMLALDPLVLGDVRRTFAQFIHNGETAVFVSAVDADEAGFATQILRLYLPIVIEMVAQRDASYPR